MATPPLDLATPPLDSPSELLATTGFASLPSATPVLCGTSLALAADGVGWAAPPRANPERGLLGGGGGRGRCIISGHSYTMGAAGSCMAADAAAAHGLGTTGPPGVSR